MKQHVSWVVALVVGFALGIVSAGALGIGASRRPAAPPPTAAAPAARPARPVEDAAAVYKVPIDGSPVKGPADALVTIVESSDFQCPFCKRVAPTLKQLEESYRGKVRFVFKHNPLSIHPLAMGAALATEAARAQGGDEKFWAMHDALFEASPALEPAGLEAAAQKLGLDPAQFKAAMAAPAARQRVERDQQLVTSLGATGTPAFFINGRKIAGAYPYDAFKKIVDEELARAEAMVRAGTPAAQVYEKIIQGGATAKVMVAGPAAPPAAAPAPEGPRPAAAPGAAPPAVYRKVTLRPDDPARGKADAPVTLVLFSDFQCPFCSRVEPTLTQLQQAYPDKVKVVWKHQPLPMHASAIPAAIAAEAAREQGKFWQMHDKLFAEQRDLTPEAFERHATALGLDLGKFKAALAARRGEDRITADQQLAGSVGVNGTPTMFLNCRQVVGAVPYDTIKAAFDEELAKATALLRGGKADAAFYDRACAANLALAAAAPAPAAAAPAAPEPSVAPDALALRPDDPVRGNPRAPVTVVVFSDFQCPFCSRVEPTLAQVEKEYGDKVKVVWKHQPLAMHPNAVPAAQAAEAAREQGKFWEMHDRLFQNQQQLSPELYGRLARELGLDAARFDAALRSQKLLARIQEDQALAGKVGVSGTPTLFVNGERVVGAVPFEQMKAVIDRQLARK
jgi:protein-disulfide isomerase